MNYPRYIKRTFIILVISCHFVSLYATNTNSSYRYEGSVSLKYSFLASLGLETVHGVRFERPGIFLGGMAAVTYGTPQGLAANIGVFSRWYFTRAEKLEIFLSLAAGYINYAGSISDSSVPPSMRPEHSIGYRF